MSMNMRCGRGVAHGAQIITDGPELGLSGKCQITYG
jgi:hypothetical protein